VSQDLLDKILYFEVGDFMGHLSDHCLISWGLICNYSKDQNEHTGKLLSFPKQFKWNAESSIADFQLALTTPSVTKLLNDLRDPPFSDGREGVEEAISKLNKILIESAKISLRYKCQKTKQVKNKKWFDKDLSTLKRGVLKAAKSL
jgi:hypothetical protein